ncbi:hypothetical protein V5P93_000893 [Actinokineospora auranticolor]|uniref:Uncharacterized protein n=1 Tax=Actinokineospora auranticolor TaxID=155976 RepID=A0A2S6GYJ2_9PSEU|nr:hypothetical protein [Actinokineospora auranticolor]PPK70230.1 hypothetical protein CLV40_102141 [Actinokineospora auranticolor]
MDSAKNRRRMIRLSVLMTAVAAVGSVLLFTTGNRIIAIILVVVLAALAVPTVRAAIRIFREYTERE